MGTFISLIILYFDCFCCTEQSYKRAKKSNENKNDQDYVEEFNDEDNIESYNHICNEEDENNKSDRSDLESDTEI